MIRIKTENGGIKYLRSGTVYNLVDMVDVFYGTNVISGSSNSRGNIFPIVSAGPHSYNHWTFTTNGNSPWFFNKDSPNFMGIRCTHQPSPWIGDYAFFDISVSSMNRWNRVMSTVTPSHMRLTNDNKVVMSLVASDTGAILKIVGAEGGRLSFKSLSDTVLVDPFVIKGTTSKTSIFKAPPHTKLNVIIISDKPIKSGFKIDHSEITLRIGTSFIDMKHAESNIPYVSYDEQLVINNKRWNDVLGKIVIHGGDVSKFYTILHRALLFPRVMSEGDNQHYSPYSKKFSVRPGQISTDSGFWDAYRTVYPFLHLVYPSLATRVLDGWVNSIKEDPDGLLPQWASPGKVDSMEGAMGEISIAEGIVNGAITDVDTAWSYLYKSCFIKGREYLSEYLMLGFVPNQVSLSLNYYLSDYVVSLAAKKLGYHDIAAQLEERSKGWRLLFDRQTKFFRPKPFDNDFDQYRWMGPYREGGPWQYRFYVPHDPVGLDSYYDNDMCRFLHEMMVGANTVSNRNKIHEENEMQQQSFGQYSHNNQPVHHVLYMFAHVGCAQDGQRWLNHALETQYGVNGYAGDEDNGEMAAWYILSRLGLYSLVPGSGEYQLGVPPPWEKVVLVERGIVIENRSKKKNWTTVSINGKTISGDGVVKINLNGDNDIKIYY